jgi:prevent-host-death family protein
VVKASDVYSLTEFQRNARSLIEKARETGTPLILTVKGRPEIVLQDAESTRHY